MNDSNDSRMVRLPVREMSDEPAPQRAAQEGDLPPLLTDEQIAEHIVACKVMDQAWPTQREITAFARAIESEVRPAIAAAGGGVPKGLQCIGYIEPYATEITDLPQSPRYQAVYVLASSPQPEAAQAVARVPEITDAMALAFHRALTDGDIGQSEVEDIKTGLRAALAAAPEAPAQADDLTISPGTLGRTPWAYGEAPAQADMGIPTTPSAGEVERCPDGLLPDGPTCPRCGGGRGPSGVDGGSWVHLRATLSHKEQP